jgi:glutamate synthase domain-containing protein 1
MRTEAWFQTIQNPHRDDKVMAACGLFGVLDTGGRRMGASDIVRAMANMHDRSNGLGGGFAVYGLYPEHAGLYSLHIMYMREEARPEAEAILQAHFTIAHAEPVLTRPSARVSDAPDFWRYFVSPRSDHQESTDDRVFEQVMRINTGVPGAFVFSSGKDMAVFKGVGYPEDIAEFFRLDDYQGYMWVGHGRFPTNTPGWWGGAHPFNVLDWTVVHNGEISSYGINARHLEMYGYHCTMQTDTEVVAYAVDLLMRRHGLPIEVAADVLAPPFWSDLERADEDTQALHRTLRQVYGSLLLNGPFTVIIAHEGEMIGLTDRIRLRPLTAAVKGDRLYLSSEEASIRLVSPDLDRVWTPTGGEPIVGRLGVPLREAPPPEAGPPLAEVPAELSSIYLKRGAGRAGAMAE